MKRSILAIILLATLVACSDEIQTGSPSIQGVVDDDYFRTTNTSGEIGQNGELSISGETDAQEITLQTEEFEEGTYTLGNGASSQASFRTFDSTLYSTATNGRGEITISRIDGGRVSGEFYFYARVNGGGDTLTVSKGAFFGIPVEGVTSPGGSDMSCTEATSQRMTAEEAYNQADAEDENFTSLCNDYREALEMEIEACGDPNGNLQSTIDGLNCGTSLSCPDAQDARATAEQNFNDTDSNSPDYNTACQAYREALQDEIEACGDPNGDIQSTIDGLDCAP